MPGRKRASIPQTQTPSAGRRGRTQLNPWPDWLERQAWPQGVPFLGNKRASLEEGRVIWYLVNRTKLIPGYDFDYQVRLNLPEGLKIVDFVVWTWGPGLMLIIEVQGEFWHASASRRFEDERRLESIIGYRAWANIKVGAAVNLWGRDINKSDARRNEVCALALRGISVGV